MEYRKVMNGAALVVAASLVGACSSPTTSAQPNRFDEATGAVQDDGVPERIKIGSDLFPAGYGWLESRNFKEVEVFGPFLVYDEQDAQEPSYWYYKGAGIVPIGTTSAQAQAQVQMIAGEETPDEGDS